MKRLLLYGTPSYDKPHWRYIEARDVMLQQASKVFEKVQFLRTGGFAHQAREDITTYASKIEAEYIVMHDDDLWVDGATKPFERWLRFMDENDDVGIIGANYLQGTPKLSTCRIFYPGRQREWSLLHGFVCPPDRAMPIQGFKPGFQDVASIGTGFVLIRPEALGELAAQEAGPVWRLPVLASRRTERATNFTEDIDICLRLQKNGWRVVVDNDVDTVHYKSIPLLWNREKWEAQKDVSVAPFVLGKNAEIRTEGEWTFMVDPETDGITVTE